MKVLELIYAMVVQGAIGTASTTSRATEPLSRRPRLRSSAAWRAHRSARSVSWRLRPPLRHTFRHSIRCSPSHARIPPRRLYLVTWSWAVCPAAKAGSLVEPAGPGLVAAPPPGALRQAGRTDGPEVDLTYLYRQRHTE
jgi:hypothetical protein